MQENLINKGRIKIQRRSPINHTHSNVIDDSIDSIHTYAIRPKKFLIVVIFYFLTLGILYILRLIFPSILLCLACEEEVPEHSNYVKLTNKSGKTKILILNSVDLCEKNAIFSSNSKVSRVSKSELMKNNYLGIEKDNMEESSKIFEYKKNKYIYSEKDNLFYPMVFDLSSLTNEQVHSALGKGSMTFNDYHFQINKYGLNNIIVQSKGLFNFIIKNALALENIYNYISVFILITNGSYTYAGFIMILTIIVIIFQVFFSVKNDYKIFKIKPTTDIDVRRGFQSEMLDFSNNNNKYNEISISNKKKENFVQQKLEPEDPNEINAGSNFYSSKFLVPGDVIVVQDDLVMPCDGIILDGSCTVDESDLNGESRKKIKFEIPNDNTPFSFVGNKKSILYQGTKISQCQSSDKKYSKLYVLVINTGLNTYRSSLIQNYDEGKSGNFHFFTDLSFLIFGLICFWVLAVIYSGICATIDLSTMQYTLFLLTIIISPCLSICINLCCILFHFKLQKRGISCISNDKLLTSGRVDTVILDKTGTLIEEELELLGFQTVNENVEFDTILTDEKYYKNKFINFWKEQMKYNFDSKTNTIKNTEYQEDSKYLTIYYAECLACCNYVNKVKNEKISGNYIDLLIYNCFNWEFETIKSKANNEANKNCVFPKNSYKIIDESITSIQNPYKLEYIKRYQFSPQTQTQSVVVKNSIDNTYRLYIKGSTDKIIEFCDDSTIPDSHDEIVRLHTQEGYRLISCATKLLSDDDVRYIEETNDINHFKEDMIFLGFVIFKNAPKRDTKRIITTLNNVGIKLILATDENPYSAQSIAVDCGIMQKEGEDVFLIDYNQDDVTGYWKFQIDLKDSSKEEDSSQHIENNEKIPFTTKDSSLIFKRHFGSELLNLNLIHSFSFNKSNVFGGEEKKHPEIIAEDLEKIRQAKNPVLCLNGSALLKIAQYQHDKSQLEEKNEFDKLELLHLVKTKAKMFYRLNHNDKTVLIKFLESEKNSIIAMCGEASIDSSSLIASDLSISLRQIEGNSNIISNYASSGNSISCIKTIMKTGRACYENNIILIKYIILIGLNRLLMQLKFIQQKDLISSRQALYLDIFCVFIPVFLSSITGANYNLSNEMPPKSLIHKKFLVSVIGQFMIQFGSQLFFIVFLANFFHFNDDETRFQSVRYNIYNI